MIHCFFCHAATPDVATAITNGWFPTFWFGEEEHARPFCGQCAARWLDQWEDEFVLPDDELADFLFARSDVRKALALLKRAGDRLEAALGGDAGHNHAMSTITKASSDLAGVLQIIDSDLN